MTDYATLRTANAARQAVWMTGTPLPLTFRTNELAGEFGEVAELLLDRWSRNGHMYSAWRDALGQELSDVVICGDIVGWTLGQPIDLARHEGLAQRADIDLKWIGYGARDVGLLCNEAKKLDRNLYSLAGAKPYQDSNIMAHLGKVMQRIYDMLYNEQYIPEVAIARKFNMTSKKVGFEVYYIPPGYDRALLIP